MNDFWNDPPEYPDAPECCEQEMDVEEDGRCICSACGKIVLPYDDYEETPEPKFDELEQIDTECYPTECPHGNSWTDCGACDHASDIAYDTARENRFFRS